MSFGDIALDILFPPRAFAQTQSQINDLKQQNANLQAQVEEQLAALTGNGSDASAKPSNASSTTSTGTPGVGSNSTILIGGAVVLLLLIVLIFLKRK